MRKIEIKKLANKLIISVTLGIVIGLVTNLWVGVSVFGVFFTFSLLSSLCDNFLCLPSTDDTEEPLTDTDEKELPPKNTMEKTKQYP